jgi:hypothetical protein
VGVGVGVAGLGVGVGVGVGVGPANAVMPIGIFLLVAPTLVPWMLLASAAST